MADEFVLKHPKMHTAWRTIGKIRDTLIEATNTSKTLSTDITQSTTFEGLSKLELLAFSDLLNKYTGAFCGLGEKKNINPTQKFDDAISCCIFNVDHFTYHTKKLNKIENN
jgi:SPX domain protein involved in polyphosphate accumulation